MPTLTTVISTIVLVASVALHTPSRGRPSSHTVLLRSATGQSTFRVPAVAQVVENSLFSFYVKYPSGNLFVPTKALVREDVRVLVAAKERERMRSTAKLGEQYTLVETLGRFKVYQASFQSRNAALPTVETIFVTTDAAGQNVMITDPGTWSTAFRVYRPYSTSIELDYQFRKSLGINEFEKVDAFVLDVVRTMQVAN